MRRTTTVSRAGAYRAYMYDLAHDTRHTTAPGDSLRRLAGRVQRALEKHGKERRVLRLTEPLEQPVHPLRWLGSQPASEKIYWSGREDASRVAAAGVADLIGGGAIGGYDALRELAEGALAGSGARYYGGLRFDPESESAGAWEEFGTWRFVLPRLELVRGEQRTEIACNLSLPRDAGRADEILGEISRLPLPAGGPAGELPLPISRLDSPDRAGWDLNVDHALAAFERGELRKTVLARRAEFGFAGDLDPELLLANLEAAAPGCFHFGIRPEGGAAFVGASPERLYRREGRQVVSEAVAGTLPRGDSAESDEALRERLLGSGKDRREHGYVRDGVREALSGLCERLSLRDSILSWRTRNQRPTSSPSGKGETRRCDNTSLA